MPDDALNQTMSKNQVHETEYLQWCLIVGTSKKLLGLSTNVHFQRLFLFKYLFDE